MHKITTHILNYQQTYKNLMRGSQNRRIGFLLLLLCITAYFPALSNGFIIDDDFLFLENPHMDSLAGLGKIWTTIENADYFPITYTFFWIQKNLWGDIPLPYHLLNILLQGAAAFLLYKILCKLQCPHPLFIAAIFTIHPVQVESVVWVAELKNLLSGIFFFTSLLYFLNYLRAKQTRQFMLSLLFFLCAILSKGTTVMLAAVVVLLYWWQTKTAPIKQWKIFVPYFALSLMGACLTIWFQGFRAGGSGPDWSPNFTEKLQLAGHAIWFYLGKLFYPHPISFNYPSWQLDSSSMLLYLPSMLALLALIFLWIRRNTYLGPAFLGFCYFLIMLFPALGFFDVYYFRMSFVADRYQYLAMLGPIAVAVAGLGKGISRIRQRVWIANLFALGVILIFSIFAWNHSKIYRDLKTLWQATLTQNPKSWMALNGLGSIYAQQKNYQLAEEKYLAAIALKSNFLPARDNLGLLYMDMGEAEKAKKTWDEILLIHPNFPQTNVNIGFYYLKQNNPQQAITYFKRAAQQYSVNISRVSLGLGQAYTQLGQYDLAIHYYQRILERFPNYGLAHSSLADMYAKLEKYDLAIMHYSKALRAMPLNPEVASKLAFALAQLGRIEEAVRVWQQALAEAKTLGLNALAEHIAEELTSHETQRTNQ